jgi:hypothetical protein
LVDETLHPDVRARLELQIASCCGHQVGDGSQVSNFRRTRQARHRISPNARNPDRRRSIAPPCWSFSETTSQYFENALTGTELSTVRVRSGREVSLNGNPAYEVLYEHDLAQQPLQVLAAIVIRRTDAYALTCSSTPAAFAELEPRFRAILESFDFGR